MPNHTPMSFLYPFITTALAAAPSIGPLDLPDTTTTTNITSTITFLFTSVLNIVLLLAGILAVFYLVYAGIQYITSAGSPEKTKNARLTIINAVIGIIIIVTTFTIIKLAVYAGRYFNTSTTGTTSHTTTTSPAKPISPKTNDSPTEGSNSGTDIPAGGSTTGSNSGTDIPAGGSTTGSNSGTDIPAGNPPPGQ